MRKVLSLWVRITSHPCLCSVIFHRMRISPRSPRTEGVFLNLGGAFAFSGSSQKDLGGTSPDGDLASSQQPERLTVGALRKGRAHRDHPASQA